MSMLSSAIEINRLDLAAHALLLAAARVLDEGVRPDVTKRRKKKTICG